MPRSVLSRDDIKKRDPVTGMEGYGTYNMPEATWTDDSSMALATGLTHNHLRSQMACGLYYFMDKEIVWNPNPGQEDYLIKCLQKGLDEGFKTYGKDPINLKEMGYYGRLFHLDQFREVPEEEILSTGYVVDSIEAAVWCLVTTDSLKECLLKAVNLGDDTDTVATIAGGLAGLYYGYENIPKDWIAVIEERDYVEEMCFKAQEEL